MYTYLHSIHIYIYVEQVTQLVAAHVSPPVSSTLRSTASKPFTKWSWCWTDVDVENPGETPREMMVKNGGFSTSM